MTINGYTFSGFKTFPGMEFPGYTFSISKGHEKFAEFVDYGNGGEPDLRAVYVPGNDRKTALHRKLTEEIKVWANEHAPIIPADPDFGLPEHKGDMDSLLAIIGDWMETEKDVKRCLKRYSESFSSIGILFQDGTAVAFAPTNQTDISVVAKGLLKGESPIERFSVAVIPTPPWNFEDGLPVGTPAVELIKEDV